MKHLFSPSRAFASLRVVVAGACVLTAAALAFVATANNNSPSSVSKKSRHTEQDTINWAYEHYDKTPPAAGPDGDLTDQNPNAAAEEEREHRAYPADELDLGALINAQAGYTNFLAHATPPPAPTVTPGPTDTPSPTATPTATPKGGKKGGRRGKGTPTPTPTPVAVIIDHPSPPEPPPLNFWQEVGGGTSHTATDPNVLTFTGSTQKVSGRITGLALDTFNGCSAGFCRVWVAAAGGGIWVTTNALAATPTWTFVSTGPGGFVTNAIGTITYVNDGTANGKLFAGTGEPNTSGDSEAGVGIYKSTDGGNTWTLLNATIAPITTSGAQGNNGTYTGNAFLGRSISSIAVNPANNNIIYVSSDRGVRGISSVTGGSTSNPTTPRPPYGVFKSTDGGNTFTYIFDGDPNCGPGTCLGAGAFSSSRGFHELRLDPNNPSIIYAADYPNAIFGVGGGIWRSTDAGASWVQIKAARNATNNVDRCAFDVAAIAGPATRMVAGCGNSTTGVGGTSSYVSVNQARIYESENASTAAVFTDITAAEAPQLQSLNYCTAQCWYDNFVYFAAGSSTDVYVGGSFKYNEFGHATDGRAVLENRFAGPGMAVGWNDFTWDAQNNGPAGTIPFGGCCQPNLIAPNGIHPDQHAIVTVPGSPLLFFEGSDGGLVRSNGTITDISGQCAGRTFPGTQFAAQGTITDCQLALGLGDAGFFGVPTVITSLDTGLATLQFQSVSVASTNVNLIQGGTQDNGTWTDLNGSTAWNQEIYGDGGQSGFMLGNSAVRFNSFTGNAHDANFTSGTPTGWFFFSWNPFSTEGANFYAPIKADPAAAGTIFEGSMSVWRTQDWGGPLSVVTCAEFTGSGVGCGDFVAIGPAGATDLTASAGDYRGTTRAGGAVAVVSRTPSNTSTLWAATNTGRIFISENASNATAGTVTFTRIDATGAAGDPGRFPTEIFIDPFNARHAWISYSGYNFNTPSQKGHVFSVTWGGAGAATFTDMSNNIWDIPITSVAFDFVTGDLYASSDFVVFRLAASNNPATQWFIAGLNMPMVETAGLTIIPGSRVLYAATHGRGIWRLSLP